MTSDASNTGSSLHDIAVAQNSEKSIRRLLAMRRYYADAKLAQFGISTLSTLFALAIPFFVWLWPSTSTLFGAAAGLWVFVARVIFVPMRDHLRLRGALVQDMFDTDVLGLDQNPSLPEPPSPEEVVRKAKRAEKKTRRKRKPWDVTNWYPIQTQTRWPQSVLICQRSSVVWARRQHQWYGVFLHIVAVAIVSGGVVIFSIAEATLLEYITSIALPSAPALLDALEEAREHLRASKARERLESATNKEIQRGSTTHARLRAIEDELFSLRQQAPLVPEWFYHLRRDQYEADMREAAKELTEKLGGA